MRNLIFCLVIVSILEATPTVKLSQWILDSWNLDSGLPQNTITAIEQTPDGYLWLATRAGIARFDGVRSTLFDRSNIPGLGTNIVAKLRLDGDGVLWAAPLEPGLLRLEGTSWKRFGAEAGLAKQEIAELHLNRRGRLWAAPYGGGLLEWDGAKFTPVVTPKALPASTILRVLNASDGSIWLGSAEHGSIRWRGESWQVYDKSSGLLSNVVRSITETAAGTILVGGLEGVDAIVDGKISPSARPFALAKKTILCALAMPGDEIWWGTFRDGLIRTHAGGAEEIKAPESLYDNQVRALFHDREGSMWIGTQGGLNRLSPPRVRFYGDREGFAQSFFGKIAVSRSGGILSTDSKGNVLDGDIGSQKIVATHPAKDAKQDLLGVSRDGTIWIFDSAELLFAVSSGRYRRQDFPRKEIANSFLETIGGEILVGTQSGALYRKKVGVWESFSPPLPLRNATITLLAEDSSGGIHVGTRNGLATLRDGVWKTWNKTNGLPSNLISALYVDPKGRTWIGTAAGIIRLTGESLLLLNKSHGLPDEAITALAEDPRGDLWAGSSSGVFRIRKQDLESLDGSGSVHLNVELLSAKDGLRNPEGRPFFRAWTTNDGSVWMNMMRGLAHIRPTTLSGNPIKPQTRIERVIVDGKTLAGGTKMVIPATASRVEFQFTTLSLLRPERNCFRFRLVGYDKDWIDGGTQRSAVYTGLKGGDYRFEAIGANGDHVESASPAAVSFEKSKAFTETPWFLFAIMLLIGSTVGFGAWLRIRRLAAQHRMVLAERQRIARELHDTLLQGFTGVTLQLEAIAKSGGPSDRTGERLRQVLEHADQYLREARQAVWDLREQPRASLADSLKAIASRPHGSIPVQCRIQGMPFPVDASIERELMSIAQEAITNAQRHSGASEIALHLKYSDTTLELCVHDNGCGFDPGRAPRVDGGHFGLAGMQERARQIGAEWKIVSGPDGTQLCATIRKD